MEKSEFRCGSFKSATQHHPVFTFAKHLGSWGKQTAHYQHLLLLPLQRTSSVAERTEPKQRWIKSVKKNKVFLGARWGEQFIHLKMCLVLSAQLKQTTFFTVFSTLLPFAGWGWGPGGGSGGVGSGGVGGVGGCYLKPCAGMPLDCTHTRTLELLKSSAWANTATRPSVS